jgi:hypothetical protein
MNPAKFPKSRHGPAVISVTEVNLARGTKGALEGEVKGGVVASRGRVRGGCGVKVAVRG